MSKRWTVEEIDGERRPPRSPCPVCGRIYSVRDDGTMRLHGYMPGYGRCRGSYTPPPKPESPLPIGRQIPPVECSCGRTIPGGSPESFAAEVYQHASDGGIHEFANPFHRYAPSDPGAPTA